DSSGTATAPRLAAKPALDRPTRMAAMAAQAMNRGSIMLGETEGGTASVGRRLGRLVNIGGSRRHLGADVFPPQAVGPHHCVERLGRAANEADIGVAVMADLV